MSMPRDRDTIAKAAIKYAAYTNSVVVMYREATGNWYYVPYPMEYTTPDLELSYIRYVLPCGEITKLS